MPLSAEQIKAIIDSQIENYQRKQSELSSELAILRGQPLHGSRELQRRLAYLESMWVEQQAKLAALQDVQQIIQTLEGLAREQ
jgi:hypothetical protein